VVALVLIIVATAQGFHMGHRGRLIPNDNMITVFAGLWFSSAVFAYLAVKLVRALDRLWSWGRKSYRANSAALPVREKELHSPPARPNATQQPSPELSLSSISAAAVELLPDPSRRYFFRTATAVAGAAPFLGAMYGFAGERLNYQVRRVEIPIANLPSALDGMRIAQLSDIHLSGYMTRPQIHRAVDMTNALGADLALLTGDYITGASDPIADCIEELRQLRAPLGVWGCNGNHEIYARAEDDAERLFAQAGMKLLRQQNALLTFRGAQFNLIGVDYQRERTAAGRKVQMLSELEPLVHRDMPNILLSHNPNSFNRAAELGIELSLAGHTHGGQIQVEILDHRLSPARFITDYIAGTYYRPLSMPALNKRALKDVNNAASNEMPIASHAQPPLSVLYVNRGLGTVGAPVRLGVPPEISLLTLRRA
jgi:predicted MPP superfamily phosphohydrolase